MEENRSIEVRSLDGRSVVMLISPDHSISDLKVLLRDRFPPATNSPDFHLCFKGSKLSLDRKVGSFCFNVEQGEFLVLVPFAKRSRQVSSVQSEVEQTLSSSQSFKSPAADSAWTDIMNDISSLVEGSSSNTSAGNEYCPLKDSTTEGSPNVKRSKEPDPNDALYEVVLTGSTNPLDKNVHHKIRGIVDSINCLTNADTGVCLLFEECFKDSGRVVQCFCPQWLRTALKRFTFLNVCYALFHKEQKILTCNYLKEALEQASCIELDGLNLSYVEKLSLLCPKVVVVLDKQQSLCSKSGSAIVVCDHPEGISKMLDSANGVQSGRRKPPVSPIVNAIGKREASFRSYLWKCIQQSTERLPSKGKPPCLLSVEDLASLEDFVFSIPRAKPVKSKTLSPPCHDKNQLEPAHMIEHLRKGLGKLGQIVHVERIAAKLADLVEIPHGLSEVMKTTLKEIGISQLYSHQAEAVQASLSGKNFVVATSTSSGKSLCYNLPVLEALSRNLSSCALYIFPTKALAQDQLRALLEMTKALDIDLQVSVYDGDTPQEQRRSVQDNARLLITNPDMLHMSILPYHGQFQRILSNLRYIVIDEAHTYKGAFGCHTALIIRRLQRLCSHVYSTNPSFIFSTATSANPHEHAMALANLQTLELVQNDGSPCGPKYFLLWNPPLQLESQRFGNKSHLKFGDKKSLTKRSSPIVEVAFLFAEMVQHGLRCITFCKSRKLSELVLSYTREILQVTAPSYVDSIRVYRAGYVPEERRRIETDLFSGKLRGVAATNALELGIDVGHIDATLHLGFPGSIASFWQQAGRSGRRLGPSLAIYVAFEGPLDQYFMKFPEKLFCGPIEHCRVDTHNQKVLEQHVACAAYELPLCRRYDQRHFGPGLENAITALKNQGVLLCNLSDGSFVEQWSYIGPEQNPSRTVSIRATETIKYKVINKAKDELLEEIEESRAFFQVYEGAVYMHQGFTYLVKELDLSEKVAFCEKADLKYYTKTRDYTDIHVIGGDFAYLPVHVSQLDHAKTTARMDACTVTTKWFGFHRIRKADNQIFDTVELFLPAYSYESQAAWIRIPKSIEASIEVLGISFRAGQHAASHALLNVVPLYLMCNPSDLSTECANPHETRDIPGRLLLYDRHPGGIGISDKVRLLFRELLTAAYELVTTCSCSSDAGCPNCVQTLSCGEYNEVIDKKAAIIILKGLIEAEISNFHTKEYSCGPNSES